ncbi:MAG: choice-of-anchor A family protein [Desulfobulbus sp.]|nr:choice-of-anchor A family protein [Desulfobulbus sp.]
MKKTLMFLAVTAQLFAAPVWAAPLSSLEILQQFNLVVLGDATSSSHVDGRAYIGGDLSGGEYTAHPGDTPTSDYAGLTVGGNATGITALNKGAVIGKDLRYSGINNGGSAVVLGDTSETSFSNNYYVGGSVGEGVTNGTRVDSLDNSEIKTIAAAATSTNFKVTLSELSTDLSELTKNSEYTATDTFIFNVSDTAKDDGIAVFDISDSTVFSKELYFTGTEGVSTIIINCSLSDTDIPIAINFANNGAYDDPDNVDNKIIWNFYKAESLTITSQFRGSILAVEAELTNSANIEGGVYVESLDQRAEIHLQSFTGEIPVSRAAPVPEPATMLLFGTGLACLAATGRKIRR